MSCVPENWLKFVLNILSTILCCIHNVFVSFSFMCRYQRWKIPLPIVAVCQNIVSCYCYIVTICSPINKYKIKFYTIKIETIAHCFLFFFFLCILGSESSKIMVHIYTQNQYCQIGFRSIKRFIPFPLQCEAVLVIRDEKIVDLDFPTDTSKCTLESRYHGFSNRKRHAAHRVSPERDQTPFLSKNVKYKQI